VKQRDDWESENPGWRQDIGKRDDLVPPPIRSLPDLPRQPAVVPQERSREEFVAWAQSEERDAEIKDLTLGNILETLQDQITRLEDLLRICGSEDQERIGDLQEKYTTVNRRLKVALELLHHLRFGWGIDLAKG
jgi:hypothetical protein